MYSNTQVQYGQAIMESIYCLAKRNLSARTETSLKQNICLVPNDSAFTGYTVLCSLNPVKI